MDRRHSIPIIGKNLLSIHLPFAHLTLPSPSFPLLFSWPPVSLLHGPARRFDWRPKCPLFSFCGAGPASLLSLGVKCRRKNEAPVIQIAINLFLSPFLFWLYPTTNSKIKKTFPSREQKNFFVPFLCGALLMPSSFLYFYDNSIEMATPSLLS